MKVYLTLSMSCLLLVSATGAWAADPEAGKAKTAACAACHGQDGIGVAPIYPNLAGQKEQYIVSALKAYRGEERAGGNAAMMLPMAKPLSDEDIANIASYYASLKPK